MCCLRCCRRCALTVAMVRRTIGMLCAMFSPGCLVVVGRARTRFAAFRMPAFWTMLVACFYAAGLIPGAATAIFVAAFILATGGFGRCDGGYGLSRTSSLPFRRGLLLTVRSYITFCCPVSP